MFFRRTRSQSRNQRGDLRLKRIQHCLHVRGRESSDLLRDARSRYPPPRYFRCGRRCRRVCRQLNWDNLRSGHVLGSGRTRRSWAFLMNAVASIIVMLEVKGRAMLLQESFKLVVIAVVARVQFRVAIDV